MPDSLHPVKVIVMTPDCGPVTSPVFVSALHISFDPPTVSKRLALLVDVNGLPNGPLNSGNADADAPENAITAATVARPSPPTRMRFISSPLLATGLSDG